MQATKYVSCESTTSFSFFNLVRRVKNELKKKSPDLESEEFLNTMMQSLRTFTINGQTFDYTYVRNHLGGVRWYVLCPKCTKQCLKLFLPSKYEDRDQLYLCKNCHNLKNVSLLLGATKRYKKVVKPLKQLESLKKQLMRRNLSPEKAQPMLDEYDRIETELAASPEYRLYKFQKEHGEKK